MKRVRYPTEFKAEVVKQVTERGHGVVDVAMTDTIALYSSPVLVDELSQMHYSKLAKRITALQTTAQASVAQHYSAIATLVVPHQQVPREIAQDADDDQVLACAVEARAHLIASGEQHLHSLVGCYQGVRIVTPAEAAELLQAV